MKHALVVGASGLLGRTLVRHLGSLEGWSVTTASRRAPPGGAGERHIALDLLDRARCLEALAGVRDATHVFFCARAVDDDYRIPLGANVDMLRNVLDGVAAAPGLRHVQLVHGLKWYGSHLGPFRNPAEESHPRLAAGENFYYAQQDLIEGRRRDHAWSWSAVRPHFICGVGVGSPSNLLSAIGAYAAILGTLGRPLTFPGPKEAWQVRLTYTDIGLLVRAMVWAATEPRCADQAFNVVNGDEFRWCEVWPALAAHYAMPAGGVESLELRTFMKDKAPVWEAIVRTRGLAPTRFADVADWAFADAVFRLAWDQTASMAKARRFGFADTVGTGAMLLRLLREYRRLKLLP